MPMMRRGPLDRYPAESVLRQASAHQTTGGIEFHSDHPATFYFSNGRVYAAAPGVELGPDGPDAAPTDEVSARRATVMLLAESLQSSTGWYFHDPLARHRWQGEWDWDTASLIMESRSHRSPAPINTLPAAAPAGATPDRVVQLQGASAVSLGADAWSLVVALAEPSTAAALVERLGWDRARVEAALAELDRPGALARPEPMTAPSAPTPHVPPTPASATSTPPTPPTSPMTVPQGALAVPNNGRHRGPLTPPPAMETTPPEKRGRRRRRR